jgi:hypothetical protein
VPTFIFSIVLLFLPVPAVFVFMGAWAVVCAWITWTYLPKSM